MPHKRCVVIWWQALAPLVSNHLLSTGCQGEILLRAAPLAFVRLLCSHRGMMCSSMIQTDSRCARSHLGLSNLIVLVKSVTSRDELTTLWLTWCQRLPLKHHFYSTSSQDVISSPSSSISLLHYSPGSQLYWKMLQGVAVQVSQGLNSHDFWHKVRVTFSHSTMFSKTKVTNFTWIYFYLFQLILFPYIFCNANHLDSIS